MMKTIKYILVLVSLLAIISAFTCLFASWVNEVDLETLGKKNIVLKIILIVLM